MKKKEAGPGQESVWDYPRPPKLEDSTREVYVVFNDTEIARSKRAKRVLETSHPPVYYLPPADVETEYLKEASGTTYCEWKGKAHYFDVEVEYSLASRAAWHYPNPTGDFKSIAGYIAFYPHKMDACYVGDEKVKAQEGDFYGGWITEDIVGPFKGGAGTEGW